MSKLLAVDLDGTLFYPKQLTRCIPKKNVKFLRKWIDEGNKVVLISSRSYDFSQKILKEIQRPVDFINYLGAQIRIDNELVRDQHIPNENLQTVINEIKDEYDILSFMITTPDFPLIMNDNVHLGKFAKAFYAFWYFWQGKYKEKYICDNKVFDEQLIKGNTYLTRILFGVKKKNHQIAKELNKKLRERFPDIEFSWTDIIIEMTPAGCTKSESLKFYVEKTGFNKEDVFVVGDSGNDITMFQEYYDHSYCMAHSYSSVKKYAKNIISRVHNLDELVLEGEK